MSKYYKCGYPDAEYGVCTDVVTNACLAAGYDLMALVSEDIAKDPKAYGIENPDPNIDFRRVRNLKVYFQRNAHGVPYVIHHSSTRQFRYEQDILEKRDDLVGHFRISE